MCMACGFTSTTYDPCVDISLDLEPNQGVSAKMGSTKSHHSCNGEADSMNSSQNCGTSTLMGCLDRFTRPERLGSDQKFFCQQCQVRQESLKQMSIRKLPLVSCFHIKRFEHSSIRNMSRKVDRYLQFPFSLDMAPYLSSSILRSRFGNRIFSFDGDEPDASNELSSEFELFAVVTHTGKLDAGHYVTYLRLSNQWYKCDDAWITQVNENIVRAAQGYMMFYVQKMLYYKASEKPTPSWYDNGTRLNFQLIVGSHGKVQNWTSKKHQVQFCIPWRPMSLTCCCPFWLKTKQLLWYIFEGRFIIFSWSKNWAWIFVALSGIGQILFIFKGMDSFKMAFDLILFFLFPLSSAHWNVVGGGLILSHDPSLEVANAWRCSLEVY